MVKKNKKKAKDSSDVSIDEALEGMDEEDVVSGESKKFKAKPLSNQEIEEEIEEAEKKISAMGDEQINKVEIKASKPISEIKKGDKIKVDNLILEVDAHYVLIKHKDTNEMAIELFDPKTDKEYQIRYFSDQVETSIEFYVLEEIIYTKKIVHRIEW